MRDEIVQLKHPTPNASEFMRRITAIVELDGREQEMVFLTNNLDWSPTSITELYRRRWEIKQNLQLADFFGNSANAVRW